jgi:hypothetical protein
MDKTLEYMKFNRQHITSYIKDHETSSMGAGHPWSDAYKLDNEFWIYHYNTCRGNIELARDYPERYLANEVFDGIRARSQSYDKQLPVTLTGLDPETAGRGWWHADKTIEVWPSTNWKNILVSGRKTRDRMVRYGPSRSQYTVHLIQKAAWYKDILRETIDIVDAAPEFIFPYEIGGKIYVMAAEFIKDGYPFIAIDGSAWDTLVGEVLGPDFTPWLSFFRRQGERGFYFLDSGITFTSLFGTMANIIVNKDSTGTIIALGDDMNWFGTDGKACNVAKPYAEVEQGDTAAQYVLGVAYNPDPFLPRLTGLKTTMDRSGKMKPVWSLLNDYGEMEEYVTEAKRTFGAERREGLSYKRSQAQRAAWAGCYHGLFGSASLLEALMNVPPGDYIAPGQLLEELVLEADIKDPFRWAEEEGIKTLFL